MKFSNVYNLPQSLVDALTLDTYDRQGDNVYSISTLVAPPKLTILRTRHFDEIEEDVSEGCWRLFGLAIHEVLARNQSKDRITEERVFLSFPSLENATPPLNKNRLYISGKPDLYEGTIDDYKVTSVWSVIFEPKGKREWHEQLNCYAYLYLKIGFQVKGLRIIAILRDWSSTKAKQDQSYPQIPFAVIDIPMWTEERQKEFLTERVKLHTKCETMADDDIPVCTAEERWEKPTTYALFKDSRKTAIKVYEDKTEATQRVAELGKSYYLQTRPGRCTRCFDYCPVNKFCNFFKNLTK